MLPNSQQRNNYNWSNAQNDPGYYSMHQPPLPDFSKPPPNFTVQPPPPINHLPHQNNSTVYQHPLAVYQPSLPPPSTSTAPSTGVYQAETFYNYPPPVYHNQQHSNPYAQVYPHQNLNKINTYVPSSTQSNWQQNTADTWQSSSSDNNATGWQQFYNHQQKNDKLYDSSNSPRFKSFSTNNSQSSRSSRKYPSNNDNNKSYYREPKEQSVPSDKHYSSHRSSSSVDRSLSNRSRRRSRSRESSRESSSRYSSKEKKNLTEREILLEKYR